MQENLHTNRDVNTQEDPEIDFKQLLFVFFNKWYWFVLSVAVMLIAGYFYLKFQTPVYEAMTSVLIKKEQGSAEQMFLLQDIGLNRGSDNIDNEIGTFRSPDMMVNIVTALELYTTYRYANRYRFFSPELYNCSPLYVRWEDVNPDKIPTTVTFKFTKKEDGLNVDAKFSLNGEIVEKSLIIETLPGYIQLPLGKFYVAKQDSIIFKDLPLEVEISNAMSLARNIVGSLEIATTTKLSSQLNIKLRNETTQKGKDILNALVQEYNKQAAADKNMVASNTAAFIEERLKNIALELGEVEGEVESFRKDYKVTDIPLQIGAYLNKTEGFDTRRQAIETQLNLITYIQEYISKSENKNKLIPNLGISDQGLVSVISDYNKLVLDRERVKTSTSESNPSLKQLNLQVENIHENIKASLSNEKNASEIALRDLDRENTLTVSKISNIPSVDRQYTGILRQQEVKSNLFIFLLQKREETNLTQAGIAPKAKIIARPYSLGGPVSPKSQFIMLLFFMLGLAIPTIIIFLKDYFQTKVEGMKDMLNLKDINVIGDIIKVEDISDNTSLIVKPNDDSVVSEMFRTMRNNLLFMLSEKDQNVVLVTSTIPKEGKTFISTNLARSLSLMDKKVILLGADIRNPKLAGVLGIPKRETGFSSYLAGLVQNHNELIEQVEPNFFVLQTGPIPPNPNELLSKKRTGELIGMLKKEFDYVVLDSAPVGVVSDTFMLSKYADACVYIVRENFTEKDTISFLNNLVHDRRLKNVAVVLNQATEQKTHGRYKYGYKYSYRYRYRYGYAQGYSKRDKI
ncbi:MAG: polysaccharide biosynthesis tyrosine autokinase [Bacteroidales bacterium]|jgi:capsular exopolysaccharide synthesis family protein